MAKTENVESADRKARVIGSLPAEWFPRWHGDTVALIASGPTAKKSNVAALRDRVRVVAVNESYQLCPWADAMYGRDGEWWKLKNGVPEFHGLKISQSDEACRLYS